MNTPVNETRGFQGSSRTLDVTVLVARCKCYNPFKGLYSPFEGLCTDFKGLESPFENIGVDCRWTRP